MRFIDIPSPSEIEINAEVDRIMALSEDDMRKEIQGGEAIPAETVEKLRAVICNVLRACLPD